MNLDEGDPFNISSAKLAVAAFAAIATALGMSSKEADEVYLTTIIYERIPETPGQIMDQIKTAFQNYKAGKNNDTQSK